MTSSVLEDLAALVGADFDRPPEWHRERQRFGSPDQERDVLQHDRHAESDDHHAHAGDRVAAARTSQAAIEQSLDQHTHEAGQDDSQEQCRDIWQTEILKQCEADERADHIDLAMRKMDDIESGKNQ